MNTLSDRAPIPNALLVLSNGQTFRGWNIGAPIAQNGEVVFNTAMTGYQEIITDPSYYRQIIAFTAPHIGNTGINQQDLESPSIYSAGIILHQLPPRSSNWRQDTTLTDWLIKHNKTGIAGVDTRRLTRMLRDEGAMGGAIVQIGVEGIEDWQTLTDYGHQLAQSFGSMSGQALAYEVSSEKAYDWHEGEWHLADNAYQTATTDERRPLVAVIDFGVKFNILRRLIAHGCRVKVFPAKVSAETIFAAKPHGVLLSNGPGDPEPCTIAINTIKALLQKKLPIFGICLGHQLMGIACGGKTEKMKFGHHGANHPVIDSHSRQVMITSQNHGFAVSAEGLPNDWIITHRSLFDGSVQGIAHVSLPFFGFQGHPEASPGPQDIDRLFAQFVKHMRSANAY